MDHKLPGIGHFLKEGGRSRYDRYFVKSKETPGAGENKNKILPAPVISRNELPKERLLTERPKTTMASEPGGTWRKSGEEPAGENRNSSSEARLSRINFYSPQVRRITPSGAEKSSLDKPDIEKENTKEEVGNKQIKGELNRIQDEVETANANGAILIVANNISAVQDGGRGEDCKPEKTISGPNGLSSSPEEGKATSTRDTEKHCGETDDVTLGEPDEGKKRTFEVRRRWKTAYAGVREEIDKTKTNNNLEVFVPDIFGCFPGLRSDRIFDISFRMSGAE